MPSERTLRLAIVAVAAVGLAVSGYLSYEEARGALPTCPAGSGGCATVAQSEYSELAGVPVAYLGIGGYLLVIAAALAPGDPGRAAGVFLAVVGFGYSAYLTWVELFVIDAVCAYCVGSAIAMTILVPLTGARLLGYGGRASVAG